MNSSGRFSALLMLSLILGACDSDDDLIAPGMSQITESKAELSGLTAVQRGSESIESDSVAWDGDGVLEYTDDSTGEVHRWERMGTDTIPHTVKLFVDDLLIATLNVTYDAWGEPAQYTVIPAADPDA